MVRYVRSVFSICVLLSFGQVTLGEGKPTGPQAFIRQSLAGLQAQTAAHAATWHLDQASEWSADQDSGLIVFTLRDGTIASAPFQIIGTYNPSEATFLWGWDHPSVRAPLRKHAQLAREWGQQHHLKEYTTRVVKCSEERAWEFTAVAARLGKANGAYRGPSGDASVFMTYGQIKLRKR
jgi:hypothetical protein